MHHLQQWKRSLGRNLQPFDGANTVHSSADDRRRRGELRERHQEVRPAAHRDRSHDGDQPGGDAQGPRMLEYLEPWT